MRNVVRVLLFIFVFTLPWDTIVLPGVGTLSRVAGMLVLGAAAFTTVVEGRFRKPRAVFWLATAFVISAAVSMFWSIAFESTFARALTYTQLLGSVWVVQEFARTPEQRESLLVAFCLGAFVPIVNVLNNFR